MVEYNSGDCNGTFEHGSQHNHCWRMTSAAMTTAHVSANGRAEPLVRNTIAHCTGCYWSRRSSKTAGNYSAHERKMRQLQLCFGEIGVVNARCRMSNFFGEMFVNVKWCSIYSKYVSCRKSFKMRNNRMMTAFSLCKGNSLAARSWFETSAHYTSQYFSRL